MSELLDARGVAIAAGDTCLYGFGVGRSIAMAEGVVVGEGFSTSAPDWTVGTSPSLTPSGRVRIRVVRRSYSDGVKPVVDVAPDRLVVLKAKGDQGGSHRDLLHFYLPPSPLPTQDDQRYEELQKALPRLEASLAKLLEGGPLPDWALIHPNFGGDEDVAREWLITRRRTDLAETQRELAAVKERLKL
ncbi:hypothetical protein ACFWPU_00820 [Streptomyces sp. NPDC058471]|uniref:hypothetical protein n=1 Tax=Streptomyces sp. NPDC058471 TaxID=3346516 RepID=UPI003659947A